MSLLGDARRLAGHDPVADHDFGLGCQFCAGPADMPFGGLRWIINHKTDCPWLSMSKIVAALETADRLLICFDDYDFPGPAPIPTPLRRLIEDLGVALSDEEPA